MKTLSTLALLTAATAAQAYTLDVNVGHSRPDNYDNVSVVGLGLGTHLNNEFHLGLNFGRKSIASEAALVDAKATSATVDLTYNLSQGGIRPFIGAGVGGVRFSGDSIHTKTAFATKLFLGVSFAITPSVEFTLTAQNSKFYSVQELQNGAKTNITSWDGIAGLRFSF
jgi:opacity protein-like surface antigen